MTGLEDSTPLSATNMDKVEPLPGTNSSGEGRTRRRSSRLGGGIRAGNRSSLALTKSDAQADGVHRASVFKKRKTKIILNQWKRYAHKHTWVIPLVILGIFTTLFAINPTPTNPIHHCIFLSYELPPEHLGAPILYGKGVWDIAFVSFYTVVLSFTREFTMQNLLRPLSKSSGLKSKAKQSRFMEQMYTAIYFMCIGPWGLYVMSRTPVWYFNTRGMYEGYPHKTHEANFKFYYLFQAAYWTQQAIVLLLGMEKPRKDIQELVGHHIVSLALIGLSYRFHFTYMGLAVYITHDISDFFLATSKVLSYIDHPLVGPYLGLFMVAWIYLRHYLNLRILWSEFNEFKTVGPYELDWETEQYKCWLSHYISTALLASLQALNLFWLWAIFRIAYRFVFYNIAEDDRSDDDQIEFLEEQRQEALARQEVDQDMAPKVLVNGQPINI